MDANERLELAVDAFMSVHMTVHGLEERRVLSVSRRGEGWSKGNRHTIAARLGVEIQKGKGE